jgi:hypothetical protein
MPSARVRAWPPAPGQNVRMLKSGGERDLALKPLGTGARAQLRPDDLERDGTIVLEVTGEVDRGHAAVSQLVLERVTVAEGGGEFGRDIGHGAA